MTTPETLGQMQPGDAVQLPDISYLASFEDVVALTILPNMTEKMWRIWAGRPLLKELLRPTKANCGVSYNGAITDVELVLMEEPYVRLQDARERGWEFSAQGWGTSIQNQEALDGFMGFTFTGQARSSSRRGLGQIQAELWYRPMPLRTWVDARDNLEGTTRRPLIYKSRSTNANNGSPIKQYYTKPHFEKEAFLELDKASRKVGWQVLRSNMCHPLFTRMTQ